MNICKTNKHTKLIHKISKSFCPPKESNKTGNTELVCSNAYDMRFEKSLG